jgi:hypothetical protein
VSRKGSDAGDLAAEDERVHGLGKDPRMEADGPVVADLMADVAAAVNRRAAAVSKDVRALTGSRHRVR